MPWLEGFLKQFIINNETRRNSQTFLSIPSTPLGLALHVEHTGFRGSVVSNGALLVQSVQLEQFVVVGGSLELLDLLSSFFKLKFN